MPHDDDKPLTPAQARQKLQKGLSDYLAGNGPETIVFRLKRSKKANETYPLKLTQQQRETLLQHTHLSRNLKNKIEQAGGGTQIVPVTWNELHKLNDETGQAAYYARNSDKKRLLAVMDRVVKFFEKEHAAVFDLDMPMTRKRPAKTDLLFQFKITLLDIKPAIWRRIQVPDCTLVDLHEYIQAAFGWENYHLHQFEIDGVQYSQPAPDGDDFDMDFEDEPDVLLSKLLPKSKRKARWIYEYDFGDGWRHEVLFEGFPPADPKAKTPICLEGERACPPEDCGGPPGYGSIMRLAPVPIQYAHLYPNKVEEISRLAGEFSLPTHASDQCVSACRYLATVLAALIQGEDREEVLSSDWKPLQQLNDIKPLHPLIQEVAQGSFRLKEPPAIQGSGWVVKSLEASLWAFHGADSFEEAVLRAVNLGDDADTTGAICGQLAGAFWGESNIPESLRSGLARTDMLENALAGILGA